MEEAELFEQYRASRSTALRNKIVEKYLYIAAVIARKFVGRGVEYDDLYQVASLALMKGVERYDPDKGVKFSTFITPTVTGEIKNYFRDRTRLVHIPRRVNEQRIVLHKEAEAFTAETGRSPSAKELAARAGLSEEEVVNAMEAGRVVSLDRPAADDENASFYDVLPAQNDGTIENIENRDEMEAAMKSLSASERTLIKLRYEEELSQTETAKRLGVSQMYVSRLERKILAKLRENFAKGMAES